MVGDYAVWSYFQSIDSPTNHSFTQAYKDRFGADRVISDPVEAGYFSVYLWKDAVEEAESFAVRSVQMIMPGYHFTAPQGNLTVDYQNQHIWKKTRIGQINERGQFNIVWASSALMQPEPYPESRTREDWDHLLLELYNSWDWNWSNPSESSP